MPAAPAQKPIQFDAEYYRRYYESRLRVSSPTEVARIARSVVAMIDWVGYGLESVLDVGAGPGLWRDWFRKRHPHVRYRSTDVSPYACKQYGHERRNITSWRAREKYGLVVCQGVLPYLSNRDTERAIDNLAAMNSGFLYLEAVTDSDLETRCLTSATDMRMRRRSARWYRARLERHYRSLAFGLWMRRTLRTGLLELEAGP